MGTPSSGVWVLMNRRWPWAASRANRLSRSWTSQSSHGESYASGAGSSGSWNTSRAQIICIHVVPLLERVLITMSPTRKGKPSQRALSSSGDV